MIAVGANGGKKPGVLCVDDSPSVPETLAVNLRASHDVVHARTGAQGLAACEARTGGFAVIVADTRLSDLPGTVFLARVRQHWPDAVRVLTTGQSEIGAAIVAAGEGEIFRFLVKPVALSTLISAVKAAAQQHRLIDAEHELLEQTLRGTVRALTDILSLQNPFAFGRVARAKAHVSALADALSLTVRWPLEVAAMLSPIGMVTLPPETVQKLTDGRTLTPPERAMLKRLPAVTEQLLANIPRLEPVREILAHQEARFDGGDGGTKKGNDLPLGSRILKLVIDYDVLQEQGADRNMALDTLRCRSGVYDVELLNTFAAVLGSQEQQAVVRELGLSLLQPGMSFVSDVRSEGGDLLVAHGHEITAGLIERIRNFSRNGGVREPMRVLVPSRLQNVGDRLLTPG